jgi:phosphoglycolate phosphatase-like HAD superfamily hydrolase
MRKRAVVVDVDGTLFHSFEGTPIPGARECLEELAKDATIFYVSGRQEFDRDMTERQLKEGNFPRGTLYLRHLPTILDSKVDVIKKIQRKGYEVVCGIGDSATDIEAYEKTGIKAIEVSSNSPWRECPCKER